MLLESLFHNVGAAIEKERSPRVGKLLNDGRIDVSGSY
jgi:hypothetical protein